MDRKGPVVFILPKAPVPKEGRIGPDTWQDWYRATELAVKIFRERSGMCLLIATDFIVSDEGSEGESYLKTLKDLGVQDSEVVFIREGSETIEQLHVADRFARAAGRPLIIVHVPIHALRVWYLCIKDEIRASCRMRLISIPKPKYFLIDLILTFLFPILDLFGLRAWYLDRLKQRRLRGKI